MPSRLTPLVTGEYYHIFNRGVARQPIFFSKFDYHRFQNVMDYYQFLDSPCSYSKLLKFPIDQRDQIKKDLAKNSNKYVSLLCYVLMPNHFHLLLRQTSDNGISKYLKELQNSYTRYINSKKQRIGTLFQGQFKAVRIEDDEQLLHVSRYIHLNPLTSYVVGSVEKLRDYPWSSLKVFINGNLFVSKDIDNLPFPKREEYWKFLTDQVEYRKSLENIHHLAFDID